MTKEVVYKKEQINQIATRLKLTKTDVSSILEGYVNYLKDKLNNGQTVKFLNVCYLIVEEKDCELETVAYISTELSNTLGISKEIVLRVLSSFEEYMINDLRNFYSYCVRGLFSAKLQRVENEKYVLRVKKSVIYNGYPIRVSSTKSFRRKVELT